MKERKFSPSFFMNTPLKIALFSFFLAEIVSEGLYWLIEGSFSWVPLIVAGISSFSIAYLGSSLGIRYRRAVEQKNEELERIARELQEANELLMIRNAELDAFAHTVAHDLRDPLNAVILGSDLSAEEVEEMPKEEILDLLQIIARSGRRINDILHELLLLAGVQRQQVELARVDMGPVVDRALDRLRYAIGEHGADIQLPEAWPAAMGYGPWLEEVWVNYVSNALKYGGRPPRVALGSTRGGSTDRVRFWVRDNGDGLSAEEQARLFLPFSRLAETRVQGHGLGLSIVRQVIERLGGEVGVESDAVPGGGSTFFFTLPVAESP